MIYHNKPVKLRGQNGNVKGFESDILVVQKQKKKNQTSF